MGVSEAVDQRAFLESGNNMQSLAWKKACSPLEEMKAGLCVSGAQRSRGTWGNRWRHTGRNWAQSTLTALQSIQLAPKSGHCMSWLDFYFYKVTWTAVWIIRDWRWGKWKLFKGYCRIPGTRRWQLSLGETSAKGEHWIWNSNWVNLKAITELNVRDTHTR